MRFVSIGMYSTCKLSVPLIHVIYARSSVTHSLQRSVSTRSHSWSVFRFVIIYPFLTKVAENPGICPKQISIMCASARDEKSTGAKHCSKCRSSVLECSRSVPDLGLTGTTHVICGAGRARVEDMCSNYFVMQVLSMLISANMIR